MQAASRLLEAHGSGAAGGNHDDYDGDDDDDDGHDIVADSYFRDRDVCA
jgi:hypothetical protein